MNLFLDTSALYAVLDRDDEHHEAARTTWARILSNSDRVIMSNYVLLETTALAQNRLGMAAVRVLFKDVLPVLTVEWVGPSDHHAAVSALLAANRRRLSLVDCSSFEVMRRLGLRYVFAFDSHFTEQGFDMV